MTGKELVKCIKGHAGKISMPVLLAEDVVYLYVFKGELTEHFSGYGDTETGMTFRNVDGDAYIDKE